MQRQIEQREWKYQPGDRVLTPNGQVHKNAGFTPEEVDNMADVDRWLEHMYDLGTPGYD